MKKYALTDVLLIGGVSENSRVKTKNELKKAIKAIGLKIRAIRNEKGLTLEEVESRGYPSWRHLQKVESGKNVTVETLIKLADALDCKPADFFD